MRAAIVLNTPVEREEEVVDDTESETIEEPASVADQNNTETQGSNI